MVTYKGKQEEEKRGGKLPHTPGRARGRRESRSCGAATTTTPGENEKGRRGDRGKKEMLALMWIAQNNFTFAPMGGYPLKLSLYQFRKGDYPASCTIFILISRKVTPSQLFFPQQLIQGSLTAIPSRAIACPPAAQFKGSVLYGFSIYSPFGVKLQSREDLNGLVSSKKRLELWNVTKWEKPGNTRKCQQ
ncbi:uncharacterized protein AAES06_021958 [Glossophaga mutica]